MRSRRKVILPPSIIASPRYLHQNFQNAIAIAREYHKPDLFITIKCIPQWPDITHSPLPNQQPQDRPDSKIHFVFKLYDKNVMLAKPLPFPKMINIGTLHSLHQHNLLLVLLVHKMQNGSKTPNLHTVCLCNMVFILKYPTNFDKKTNDS